MEHVITAEARKLLGERLRTLKDLTGEGPHLEAALRECDGAPSCLVEIVGGLGWSAIVVGNVTGLGEQRVITMRALDGHTGAVLGKVEIPASGEEHQLIAQIRRALVELVAPDLYVGVLELISVQSDVQILVDGQLLATTPLTQSRFALPVGRHALEARGEGMVTFSQLVDIAYEQTNRVTIDLPLNTVFVGGDTPFHSRWYTWAIAGAGAVGVGLGAYFNSLQNETSDRIEARARAGTLTVDDSRLFVEERDHWTRAKVFYGIGAALLSGVGILLTFDL
jgi:hypothetical protein